MYNFSSYLKIVCYIYSHNEIFGSLKKSRFFTCFIEQIICNYVKSDCLRKLWKIGIFFRNKSDHRLKLRVLLLFHIVRGLNKYLLSTELASLIVWTVSIWGISRQYKENNWFSWTSDFIQCGGNITRVEGNTIYTCTRFENIGSTIEKLILALVKALTSRKVIKLRLASKFCQLKKLHARWDCLIS